MAETLDDLIERLGPEAFPFERTEPGKKPAEEEVIDFSDAAYDAIRDEPPDPSSHHVVNNEIQLKTAYDESNGINSDQIAIPKEKMFIWLIYKKKGALQFRIIPDNFENEAGKNKVGGRPNACHSNLAAGEKALQGGECWWCNETNTMYVNYKSGRYGAKTIKQWNAVVEFFKYVGYKNVIKINPKGWTLQN